MILLTGDGADPHKSQNDRVENPSGEFAAPLDRRALLEMTLSRALSIVPREQIVAVVARAQHRYWSEPLAVLPGANVIVQPYHRGSAIAALLAVLTILERDPLVRIITMPSHYYVSNETALADSLLDAALYRCRSRPGAPRDTSCVRAGSCGPNGNSPGARRRCAIARVDTAPCGFAICRFVPRSGPRR